MSCDAWNYGPPFFTKEGNIHVPYLGVKPPRPEDKKPEEKKYTGNFPGCRSLGIYSV